ncbi:MAG: hypothetical protein CMI35_01855 [Owenweeksia sp.]|nr:hypothetical protein [Owenweeksia sp.]
MRSSTFTNQQDLSAQDALNQSLAKLQKHFQIAVLNSRSRVFYFLPEKQDRTERTINREILIILLDSLILFLILRLEILR